MDKYDEAFLKLVRKKRRADLIKTILLIITVALIMCFSGVFN